MSGSNIGDGLVTTLTTASAFDAGNVSKDDFGVMDTTSMCAIIVQPWGLANTTHAYGKPAWDIAWNIGLDVYVRDTGDPQEVLHNIWKVATEVLAAVQADTSLNSSACGAVISSMTRPRDTWAEAGGQTWAPLYFTVTAMEVMV
jgi:hypothetical protein